MSSKNGFTGEVQLAIDGLPHGITASCGRILADKGQDGCIVLEAEADAPPSAAEIVVTGIAKHTLPDGQVLDLSVTSETYPIKPDGLQPDLAWGGDVPFVDVAATFDPQSNQGLSTAP